MPHSYNVLFLCTGNSSRSIMAEAILSQKGQPTYTAYSAGSHPTGFIHPGALRQLEAAHLPTEGLRSKSWNEFAKPGAPKMDFVFTLCDNAAKETCPVWPGQPMTTHWFVADPRKHLRYAGASWTLVPRRVNHPRPSNQPLRVIADFQPRRARHQARNRSHRFAAAGLARSY